ncbi:CopD family protein [Alteromonas sp. ASW11-36]|uniref:Copper resistance protein D n=1 Tax=Alteromonas arenosi TaxID=3055817 RepID=A0ABT7SUT5_9ALTE|nr:CopD family protein [Alteromonas sp. ASW11-36]MDM7859938.1 CopD family protein [Alteromonas sp. ASW11-36]
MEMMIWNSITVLSKVLIYMGFAGLAGCLFFSHINNKNDRTKHIEKTILFLALIASIFWFFAKVGAMAEEGIKGALDKDLISMMWSTAVGEVTVCRVLSFAFALAALFCFSQSKWRYLQRFILLLSLITIAYSFTLIGHISSQGYLEKALLFTHVLIMAWWIGALYPLQQACSRLKTRELHCVMAKFGQQARFMMGTLFIAGLGLAYSLLGCFESLLNSRYGQMLVVKLILVAFILLLAVKHKYRLVPNLKRELGSARLKHSISIEMVIALLILLLTAVLSSVVGPEY